MSPIELFDQTVSSKLLDLLVYHTNEYATKIDAGEDMNARLPRCPESRSHRSSKTDLNETSKYLALILSMAQTKKGNLIHH